jgi:hypothetical protein
VCTPRFYDEIFTHFSCPDLKRQQTLHP